MHVAAHMVLLASVLLFLFALWRGASPERLLTGALLVAASVQQISGLGWPSASARTDALVCVLADVLLFATILAVALHANRLYPLWLGGAQIVRLASHFAAAALTLRPQAYATMQQVPFYFELIIMALGLLSHHARRRRAGTAVPSWTD